MNCTDDEALLHLPKGYKGTLLRNNILQVNFMEIHSLFLILNSTIFLSPEFFSKSKGNSSRLHLLKSSFGGLHENV